MRILWQHIELVLASYDGTLPLLAIGGCTADCTVTGDSLVVLKGSAQAGSSILPSTPSRRSPHPGEGPAHPPIGARGFAPQNSCVPSIPMRCTSTMFNTIDFAVAVPTPTGPPRA